MSNQTHKYDFDPNCLMMKTRDARLEHLSLLLAL